MCKIYGSPSPDTFFFRYLYAFLLQACPRLGLCLLGTWAASRSKALAPSHITVALCMYFYYHRTIYARFCLDNMLTLTLWYPVPNRPRSANIGSGWPIRSCHRGSPIIALEFSAIQPAFQLPQLPLAPTGLNPCLITSLPAPSKSLRLISPLW